MESVRWIGGYWRDGGILLIPIALVAVGIWVYILGLSRRLRDTLQAGLRVESRLDAWLRGSIGQDALLADLDAVDAFPCRPAAGVLRSVRDAGYSRNAFDGASAAYGKAMRTDLFLLRTLTGVAPLLGLLGTVSGMAHTFAGMSYQGGDGGEWVAAGISAALITTQFGLIAALPGVFGVTQLGRRFARVRGLLGSIGMLIYIGKSGGHGRC